MYMITSHILSLGCVLQGGWTALHYAAWKGHHGIVLDLIKMQAEVNALTRVCENIQTIVIVLACLCSGELNVFNICIAK